MRRLRRFAVALLGVLLLPMTPLGAGASCAALVGQPLASAAQVVTRVAAADLAPARAVHADAVHADAGHTDAVHSHHSRGPVLDVPLPGHEPAPPHHGGDASCPTATACANVATAGRSPDLAASDAPATGGVALHDVSGPASVVRAPEPPPPRVLSA